MTARITKFTDEPCTCRECEERNGDLAMDEEKDLRDGGLGSGRWILDQYEGLWVLWGPYEHPAGESMDYKDVDCPSCGGTGSRVVDSCSMKPDGSPTDRDMIARNTGLKHWTPRKIQ